MPVAGEVFAFSPNWVRPVNERLSWLTDIVQVYDGGEQRIALRSTPRRRIEYELLTVEQDATYLDALLWAWQSQPYVVPMWMDAQHLTGALAPGATTIPVITGGYDYHAGGLALIARGPREYEVLEIDAVEVDTITLAEPTFAAWPAGTRIYPARTGRLPEAQPVERLTAGLVRAIVAFELIDNTVVEPAVETVYYSEGLDTRRPNRVRSLEADYRRKLERLDFGTGAVTIDDESGRPEIVRGLEYLLHGRTDIHDFRRFLHTRQGRAHSVYLPNWQTDPQVTRTLASGATQLFVRDIDYDLYLDLDVGRRDLALLHADGTWYFRRVTGVLNFPDTQEHRFTLHAGIDREVAPGEWQLVTWLELARLDSDQIELAWLTSELVQVSLPVRGLLR